MTNQKHKCAFEGCEEMLKRKGALYCRLHGNRVRANARYYADPEASKARGRESYQRHVEKRKAESREHRASLHLPENKSKKLKAAVYGLDYRCKKEGIPFDKEFMYAFVESTPAHCACCGIELDYCGPKGDKTPSIDKVVPSHGYVQGLVNIVCLRCNRLKSDMTLDELKTIWKYIESNTMRGAAA